MLKQLTNHAANIGVIMLGILLFGCGDSGSSVQQNNTASGKSGLTSATSSSKAIDGTVVFNDPNRRLPHVGTKAKLVVQVSQANPEFSFDPVLNSDSSFNLSSITTSNGNTYTFDLSKLTTVQFNKSYTLTISDANDPTNVAVYYFDTQPVYTVFTSTSKKNNSKERMQNGGYGIEWTDQYLCATAAADRGFDTQNYDYKAILGSDGREPSDISHGKREICTPNTTSALTSLEKGGFCGGSYSANWIFQPNSDYFKANQTTLLQISDNYGILAFNWKDDVSWDSGSIRAVWSGFRSNWTTTTYNQLGDISCNAWGSSHSENKGTVGWIDYTNAQAIDIGYDDTNCGTWLAVMCVQQPKIALVQPANTSAAPVSTPVEIQLPYQVGNPDNITSGGHDNGNFSVFQEPGNILVYGSIAQVPNNDGTTTAPNNTNFVFTPDTPFQAGATYKVVVNGDGGPTPIVDGLGTTAPYFEKTFTIESVESIPDNQYPQPILISPNEATLLKISESVTNGMAFTYVIPSRTTSNLATIAPVIKQCTGTSTVESTTPPFIPQQCQLTELVTTLTYESSYGAQYTYTLNQSLSPGNYVIELDTMQGTTPVNSQRFLRVIDPSQVAIMVAPHSPQNMSSVQSLFLHFRESFGYIDLESSISVINNTTGAVIPSDVWIADQTTSNVEISFESAIGVGSYTVKDNGNLYFSSGDQALFNINFNVGGGSNGPTPTLEGNLNLANYPLNPTIIIDYHSAITGDVYNSVTITGNNGLNTYTTNTAKIGAHQTLTTLASPLPAGTNLTVTINSITTAAGDSVKSTVALTTESFTDNRIFVTSMPYYASMTESAENYIKYLNNGIPSSGKLRADALCNSDPAHQSYYDQGRVFKAVITVKDYPNMAMPADRHLVTSRFACQTSSLMTNSVACGAGNSLDWPLLTSTTYYNDNKDVVSTTDKNGLFPNAALTNPVVEGGMVTPVWSGMNSGNWTGFGIGVAASCSAWSKSAGPRVLETSYGDASSTVYNNGLVLFGAGIVQCNDIPKQLICAQI